MKNLLNSYISRTAHSANLVILCYIGSITGFVTARKRLPPNLFYLEKMELECSDLHFTATCLFPVIWKKIWNICEVTVVVA